jgi:predicted O-methyltransferase YrrM
MNNWAMTITGTASYEGIEGLPKVVVRAVQMAKKLHFENSCRVEQGRLLQVVAAGQRGGVIGETGTGCGVGLSWMLSGAGNDGQLFSVDIDSERAHACQNLFKSYPNVHVENADWTGLLHHGPFDLLVLDGGGSGKIGAPIVVDEVLKFGGTLIIDDFTPFVEWPPTHEGRRDEARLFWLNHDKLLATEVRLSEDLSTIVATRIR